MKDSKSPNLLSESIIMGALIILTTFGVIAIMNAF